MLTHPELFYHIWLGWFHGTRTPAGHLMPNFACTHIKPKIYKRILSRYEVYTISFQTFFVWAFKIGVDSWKFTMLLLYILWDNWPIFMISGSNEQLIHPTKAWLSQLVNFKNAIWTSGHFRRMTCNKILF